jgi:hypothetical protein
LNKGGDELSSLGKHIHPSQLTEQSHQVQALFHMLMTEKKNGVNKLIIILRKRILSNK